MSERTFQVKTPHMHGDDIANWQGEIVNLFALMDIECPLARDGDYGIETRSYTASLCEAYGILSNEAMAKGVTPQLRTKLRGNNFSDAERKRFEERVDYRRGLRKKWDEMKHGDCALPVKHIIAHSWGYHPGVHDGLDVITEADPQIFAVVKSKVIDARSSGWWGLGKPSNPELAAKGDGIIQLEVLENVGPFKKGMHIGYGHAEKAVVKKGQLVKAGELIGHAGLANAWHIHWMFNDGSTSQGRGNLDPEPFLEYLIHHA